MMALKYQSTRDLNQTKITPTKAILSGLSHDGGLFVPDKLPKLDLTLTQLPHLSYQELAFKILQPFFNDYPTEILRENLQKAYQTQWDTPEITPLKSFGQVNYLELFHGPTLAFKDVALQLLPHLMLSANELNHDQNEIVILTATSGDTGKAAMAGFSDVSHTQIIVFYPKDGVSVIQERQMLTQTGQNTHVLGLLGNFDDAQNEVKRLFNDPDLTATLLSRHQRFSSANSINIGRLFPQVVYYFFAYGRLLEKGVIKAGNQVNFSVPTGNFGDILAGWFAKNLGLPIHKLICASNQNNVLYDFFNQGTYDKKRPFYVTNSPSMDILVSSNLERLLYYISGKDADLTQRLLSDLQKKGAYTITENMQAQLRDFFADFADEKQTLAEIKRVYHEFNYLIDPHTAVASKAYQVYQEKTGDKRPTVILATASPFKFPQTVLNALGVTSDYLTALTKLADFTGIPVPAAIDGLFQKPLLHHQVISPMQMKETILASLRA